MQIIKCRRCDLIVHPDAQFCRRCGIELSRMSAAWRSSKQFLWFVIGLWLWPTKMLWRFVCWFWSGFCEGFVAVLTSIRISDLGDKPLKKKPLFPVRSTP